MDSSLDLHAPIVILVFLWVLDLAYFSYDQHQKNKGIFNRNRESICERVQFDAHYYPSSPRKDMQRHLALSESSLHVILRGRLPEHRRRANPATIFQPAGDDLAGDDLELFPSDHRGFVGVLSDDQRV